MKDHTHVKGEFEMSYPDGWTREQKIEAYSKVRGTAADPAIKLRKHMKKDHPGAKPGLIGGWDWLHFCEHGS